MESTQTMEWVDDALQPWIANHLVEVPQKVRLTTQSSPSLGPDITTKLKPYLVSQETLD